MNLSHPPGPQHHYPGAPWIVLPVVPFAQSSALLLDTYTGAAAAYSLRKLRTAYSGSAVRVRRSSDNAEADIGFTAGGDLDTTALLAHVGTGGDDVGYVCTWYDQSGNAHNQSQATANAQPKIVDSGSVLADGNSKARMYYAYSPESMLANTDALTLQPVTVLAVVNVPGGSVADIVDADTTGGLQLRHSSGTLSLVKRLTAVIATATSAFASNTTVITGVTYAADGSWEFQLNNGSVGSGSGGASLSASGTNIFGQNFYGYAQELVIWSSVLASVSGAKSDMNTYWGVY